MIADEKTRAPHVLGQDNDIELAGDIEMSGRLEVVGNRNRIAAGAAVKVEKYAPAGFSATVPDLGRRSDASLLIEGDDNVVEIAQGVRLAVNLLVRGNGNRVQIGADAYLHGFINVITDNAVLTIGARTTMVQGSLQVHEPTTMTVGDDCMISSQVFLAVSDMHPVFDLTNGDRINPGGAVSVGDHVWLGLRTMVLKGTSIGSGSVTAAGSIVSGVVPRNVIVAGAPARVVRENIEWRRDLDDAGPGVTMRQSATARRSWWRLFR